MAASNQDGRNFCACNVGCRLMSRPWVACVLAVLELVLVLRSLEGKCQEYGRLTQVSHPLRCSTPTLQALLRG